MLSKRVTSLAKACHSRSSFQLEYVGTALSMSDSSRLKAEEERSIAGSRAIYFKCLPLHRVPFHFVIHLIIALCSEGNIAL